jgi:hypothetical protein
MSAVPVLSMILSILWSSLVAFLSLTGGLVLCGFILGYLERLSNNNMIRAFGLKGIYVTAWLGTPIHELSHAAMCLIFGHRVTGIKLFQRSDANGTIGFVTHAYNPDSLYQRIGNLFIGTAPLIGGSLAILLFGRLLLPDIFKQMITLIFSGGRAFLWTAPESWAVYWRRFSEVFAVLFSGIRPADYRFWLFSLLAICTASHMSLSMEDIRGAASGAGAFILLIVIANVISAVLDPSLSGQSMSLIGQLNSFLLLMMGLAVFFSIIKFLLSGMVYGLRRFPGKY